MTDLQFLAGVQGRRASSPAPISSQDIVSDRYRGLMKAQMQAVTASFMQMIEDIKEVTPDILEEALEPTLELAKEYCPKKTGALVDSSFLEKQTYQGGARVIIGFAKDGSPDYGILVHEMTNLHHEPPTRSKFLLAAIEEDMANIYGRLVEKFRLP